MKDRIEHVVILQMENRGFDHLLGWLYDEGEAPAHNIPPLPTLLEWQGQSDRSQWKMGERVHNAPTFAEVLQRLIADGDKLTTRGGEWAPWRIVTPPADAQGASTEKPLAKLVDEAKKLVDKL